MADKNREQSRIDVQRGIQNTNVRFGVKTEDRTMQKRLLTAAHDERFNDIVDDTTDSEEASLRAAEEEEWQGIQQQLIAQQQEKLREVVNAKRKKKQQSKVDSTKQFSHFLQTKAILLVAGFQFTLACGYTVAFGLKIAQQVFCQTLTGTIVCTATGAMGEALDLFTGNVGSISFLDTMLWNFGGMVGIITIFIVVATLIASFMQGKTPLLTTGSFFLMCICITANMIPVLCLLVPIQWWAGYQLGNSIFARLLGLSSTIKKA